MLPTLKYFEFGNAPISKAQITAFFSAWGCRPFESLEEWNTNAVSGAGAFIGDCDYFIDRTGTPHLVQGDGCLTVKNFGTVVAVREREQYEKGEKLLPCEKPVFFSEMNEAMLLSREEIARLYQLMPFGKEIDAALLECSFFVRGTHKNIHGIETVGVYQKGEMTEGWPCAQPIHNCIVREFQEQEVLPIPLALNPLLAERFKARGLLEGLRKEQPLFVIDFSNLATAYRCQQDLQSIMLPYLRGHRTLRLFSEVQAVECASKHSGRIRLWWDDFTAVVKYDHHPSDFFTECAELRGQNSVFRHLQDADIFGTGNSTVFAFAKKCADRLFQERKLLQSTCFYKPRNISSEDLACYFAPDGTQFIGGEEPLQLFIRKEANPFM